MREKPIYAYAVENKHGDLELYSEERRDVSNPMSPKSSLSNSVIPVSSERNTMMADGLNRFRSGHNFELVDIASLVKEGIIPRTRLREMDILDYHLLMRKIKYSRGTKNDNKLFSYGELDNKLFSYGKLD